ncbi:hypothetical protein LTR93_012328, partial [Exophiala xenobiotica]
SFTAEQIEEFKTNHQSYQQFRKDIEIELQSNHKIVVKGSTEQIIALELFTQEMQRRLSQKPALIENLLPSFPPVCRRLTPGPGYLEALTSPKVDLVTTEILKVDATGIITVDGKHRQVEAIVCATGFDTSFSPRFPIHGKDGASLVDVWKDYPSTYLSVGVDNFPNYFMSLGPNSALGTGNLLLFIERAIDYITSCI